MIVVVISALAFLLLLSFLVIIHECGHFFAARWSGVVVEEFGFGLPPRAKTLFYQGVTRFSLNWIPFGGFVRLKGENALTERERTAPGSFGAASIPARILILTAGVLMNFLVAIVIFTLGFSLWRWVPTYVSCEDMKRGAAAGEISLERGVVIASAVEGGTAAGAGVPSGSTLLRVDDTDVYCHQDVVDAQLGKTDVLYILRLSDGSERTIRVPVADGKTGIAMEYSPAVTSPLRSPINAVMLSFREAYVMTTQTIIGVGQLALSLATRARVPEGITGIVGIAVLTHSTVQAGFMRYLQLVAMLSLSLAILNILPFPALDGGRLVFILYELIRRRPAPRQFELMTNMIGFAVLILLIVIVTYHDILRLF